MSSPLATEQSWKHGRYGLHALNKTIDVISELRPSFVNDLLLIRSQSEGAVSKLLVELISPYVSE